jgi:predicted nuclease with TOPRIM domain
LQKRVLDTPEKRASGSAASLQQQQDRSIQLLKAQYDERIRTLQTRVEELTAANVVLSDQNEDLQIDKEEMQDKLNRLETQARNERRELTGKIGELAASNAALDAKVRALEQSTRIGSSFVAY